MVKIVKSVDFEAVDVVEDVEIILYSYLEVVEVVQPLI